MEGRGLAAGFRAFEASGNARTTGATSGRDAALPPMMIMRGDPHLAAKRLLSWRNRSY
jgi:hypothetical protein